MAAIVMAIILAAATIVMNKQTGAMVMIAGGVVGYAVKFFAPKDSLKFGAIGAILAVLSSVLSTGFCIIGLLGNATGISYLDVFANLGIDRIIEFASMDFGFMDILFYGIAAYIGFAIGCNSSEKKEENAEQNNSSDETPKEN